MNNDLIIKIQVAFEDGQKVKLLLSSGESIKVDGILQMNREIVTFGQERKNPEEPTKQVTLLISTIIGFQSYS